MTSLRKLVLLSISSTFLFAQNTPNSSDIDKQIPNLKLEKSKTPIPNIDVKKETINEKKKKEKTIFIKDISFKGNKKVSTQSLQDLVQDFKNKELSFTDIKNLTNIITNYYRKNTYFTSRAYIPKQALNDGILSIGIIEGKYGEFDIENNTLFDDETIKNIFELAKESEIVSSKALERSMLLTNDLAGISISKMKIKAGADTGYSNFKIVADETNIYSGYLLLDNAGSKYTGENRLIAGVNLNSLFDIGEKLSLSGLISDETNLKNIKVAYNIPLSSSGLTGEVYFSKTTYNLEEEYAPLEAEGSSRNVGLVFKYPLIRSKLENLFGEVEISNKTLKDQQLNTASTSKKINKLELSLNYNKTYLLSNFITNSDIDFILTSGKLNGADDQVTANTEGKYKKVNLNLSNEAQVSKNFSLHSSLKLQYALKNKNLDGSEDFSLGGQYGVKLYPNGELSAENGYLFNIETKYSLPSINSYSSKIGLFYDRGRVHMAQKDANFESRTLQDIGVGYYSSYKDLFAQIQVVWNIDNDKITSEPNRNSKILFQSGLIF